mgnify:CR=1 FL=1
MRDLVIMPAMAQRRESLNMGEFAEEAIIVEEVAAPKRVNHFICLLYTSPSPRDTR